MLSGAARSKSIARAFQVRHFAAMVMTEALAETLAMVGAIAEGATDPWWIIGSAAVVLHGGAVARVRDVDLMMSARDAERFLRRVGAEPRRGTGDQRFRSAVFGTWLGPPVPVEAFGGFDIAVDATWRTVELDTREAVTVAGARIHVPSREELVRLLRSFGRAKDLERARVLERS
jgi:hypothetical protein